MEKHLVKYFTEKVLYIFETSFETVLILKLWLACEFQSFDWHVLCSSQSEFTYLFLCQHIQMLMVWESDSKKSFFWTCADVMKCLFLCLISFRKFALYFLVVNKYRKKVVVEQLTSFFSLKLLLKCIVIVLLRHWLISRSLMVS